MPKYGKSHCISEAIMKSEKLFYSCPWPWDPIGKSENWRGNPYLERLMGVCELLPYRL